MTQETSLNRGGALSTCLRLTVVVRAGNNRVISESVAEWQSRWQSENFANAEIVGKDTCQPDCRRSNPRRELHARVEAQCKPFSVRCCRLTPSAK